MMVEGLLTGLGLAMLMLMATAIVLWLLGIVLKAMHWVLRLLSQIRRAEGDREMANHSKL